MDETLIPIDVQAHISNIEAFGQWLVDFVHHFGYAGIFIMTFLESTFMPIPGEITMIPAGVLVQQGQMNFWIVFIVSTVGSIGGALFNYWLAYHFGRRFFYAYGKYFFFPHDKLDKIDSFFKEHGDVSTFTGRLVPGVRHFISFPAGLAHMNLKKFFIYTGLGSSIWMFTLIVVGYFIGDNKELVHKYMPYITGVLILFVVLGLTFYVRNGKKKKAKMKEEKSETL